MMLGEYENWSRIMSPGQVLLAAFAFACASLIALGNSTLKGDRRQNSAICSRQISRVSGCIGLAANAGVPPNRTTEMANNLVIGIKRIFLLLLVGAASALQPIKPTAVRGARRLLLRATDIGSYFANTAKFLFRNSAAA
jgi:hypothetical protein